jgi:hypothetical protein
VSAADDDIAGAADDHAAMVRSAIEGHGVQAVDEHR